MYFFYREGRDPLVPWLRPDLDVYLGPVNPPPVVPGMAGVHLDGTGRLVQMYALPPQHDPAGAVAAAGDWWRLLFRAAGFDPDRFEADQTPEWTPPCVCACSSIPSRAVIRPAVSTMSAGMPSRSSRLTR